MIEINKNKLVPAIMATWGEITGNIENQTDLMNELSSYATESWVLSQHYLSSAGLDAYATKAWVSDQGYLTSETLPSDLATESWVQSQGYLTSVPDTFATKAWVSDQGYLTSETLPSDLATESWVASQGYITSSALSGYATESWVSSQGYLTSVPDTFATKAWVSDQGYLTSETLPSDLATESWVLSQSYLSAGDSSIAPLVATSCAYPAKAAKWENESALLETDVDNNVKNGVFNINGEMYLWRSHINNKIYKFNRSTYKFELYAELYNLTESQCMLWSPGDGWVYAINQNERYVFINFFNPDDYGYVHMIEWYGMEDIPFTFNNNNNSNTIIDLGENGIWNCDYTSGLAYPFIPAEGTDPEDNPGYFDSSSPITFIASRSDWYNRVGYYEGHCMYFYNDEYDAVFTQGTSIVFTKLEQPLMPELDGSHPNMKYVLNVNGDYYDMYIPNIYKLVNGEWTNIGADFSGAPNASGNIAGAVLGSENMLFGYAYMSGGNQIPYLLIVNLSNNNKGEYNILIHTVEEIAEAVGVATQITNNILS